jgi:hypothetical protein
VGGDLDARDRAELVSRVDGDEDLAAEARRCEAARRDLLLLRERRPPFEAEDDVWPAIRSRVCGALAEKPRPRIVRVLAIPAVRAAGVAAVVLFSFWLGFSLRDIGRALGPGGGPGSPATVEMPGGLSGEAVAMPGGGGADPESDAMAGDDDRLLEVFPEIPGTRFPGRYQLIPVGTFDF